MTWSSTAPDITRSVKANGSILTENTTYTETTMGNTANDTTNTNVIRDHYWNVDSTFDGRHRFINSPAYTISGNPADPVLGASMGSVTYSKTKSAVESPSNQDVQPFYRNAGGIMQLSAMRACVVFDLTPSAPASAAPVVTLRYAYNINNAGIDVTAMTHPGRAFTINFITTLPSAYYMIDAGCINPVGTEMRIGLIGVATGAQATAKSTTFSKFQAFGVTSSTSIPRQIWLTFYGG